MKKVFVILLTTVLLAVAFSAMGEEAPGYSFFPLVTYRHFTCDAPNNTMTFDAVFFDDGYVYGVDADRQEIWGYYALLPDGTLLLDTFRLATEMTPNADSSYTGANSDGTGNCVLTFADRDSVIAQVDAAGLYVDEINGRPDVTHYDGLVYGHVTEPNGVEVIVNPQWSNMVAGTLPCGTRVIVKGETEDGEQLWVTADGVCGFVPGDSIEPEMTQIAEVVRASKKDKGISVNVRSTPDYGDNVIDEVPYGARVVVYPVVEGEFTQVLLDDYTVGWMTTVRLKVLEDPYGVD